MQYLLFQKKKKNKQNKTKQTKKKSREHEKNIFSSKNTFVPYTAVMIAPWFY